MPNPGWCSAQEEDKRGEATYHDGGGGWKSGHLLMNTHTRVSLLPSSIGIWSWHVQQLFFQGEQQLFFSSASLFHFPFTFFFFLSWHLQQQLNFFLQSCSLAGGKCCARWGLTDQMINCRQHQSRTLSSSAGSLPPRVAQHQILRTAWR